LSDSVALVRFDDHARAYDFGPGHPLRPERVLLTYQRIHELGLHELDNVREVDPRPATGAEILAVHDEEFVAAVKGIDEGEVEQWAGLEFGLGTPDNPIFDNMHDASAAVCGASIVAAELVASDSVQHGFNPAGGLHHARRREASGFCIYDDPAAAVAKVLAMQPEWRVMYVDVDVHHGDGVQWIFYDEPRVLTVSFHQSGASLYPGTGFEYELGEGDARGTAANIPLAPFTGEECYLWAVGETLPALAGAFRPHLLVTQLGADTHHGDPLASLSLTLTAYPLLARILHDVAHRFAAGRWVATGGGGYQAETVVPKVWAIHFAEMCGAPDIVPPEWLRDSPPAHSSSNGRDAVERSVRMVIESCKPRLEAIAAAS
jgi:acetoin utilization protein AcuC